MDLCKAELTWRADHYELCLTMDTGIENPLLKESGQVAGVDLGEVNIAAVATEAGDTAGGERAGAALGEAAAQQTPCCAHFPHRSLQTRLETPSQAGEEQGAGKRQVETPAARHPAQSQPSGG